MPNAVTSNIQATASTSFSVGISSSLVATINSVGMAFAAAAIVTTSAGAMTLDSASVLNLGTSTATSISLGPSTVSWLVSTASPTLTQPTPTTVSSGAGTAAHNMAITAQSGGATTATGQNGGAGGNVVISYGNGGTAGTGGTHGAGGSVSVGASGNPVPVATFNASGLFPGQNNTFNLGLPSLLWGGVNLSTGGANVYTLPTDSFPGASLNTTHLVFGNASSFDVGITRSATSTLSITNASATTFASVTSTNLTFPTGAFTVSTTAGALTVDSSAALNLGTSTATSVAVGKSGITTTVTGGLTQLTGAVSITANGASSFTTSAGALTLTAAAASTWSTSAGALTVDSAAALNLGTSAATSIAVGKSGITTTVTGGFTQQTGAVSITANATSSFTTSAGTLSLSGTTGLNLQFAGTNALQFTSATQMNPGATQTFNFGSAARQIAGINCVNYFSFILTSDTQPAGRFYYLGMFLGPGGATSTPDVGVTRTSAGLLSITNGSTTAFATFSSTVNTVQSTNLELFSATGSFGGGSGVVGIANATTAPTSSPTGGSILYSSGGGLFVYESGGNNFEIGHMAGDVTGISNATTVGKILNITVPTPTGTNTVLTYNAGAYTWSTAGTSVVWGGDLAGSSATTQYVQSISGNAGAGGTVAITANKLSFSQASSITSTAGAVTHDSAAALNLGTATATSIAIGYSTITTTVTGGLTQLTGAVSLTGNAASSLTTSSGALTITSAAAATWSTAAGALTVNGTAGITLQVAGTTVATMAAAQITFPGSNYLLKTSAGPLSVDSFSALNLGGSQATSVNLGGGSTTVTTVQSINFALFSSTGSFGGGNRVASMATVTTAPSSVPSGALIFYVSSGNAFTTYDPTGTFTTVSPISAGTVNTQVQTLPKYQEYGRITASGGTVTFNIPLPTSSTGMTVNVRAIARVVTQGSITNVGDLYVNVVTGSFKNVSGTVTQVGTTTTLVTQADTGFNQPTSGISFTISGTNVVVTLTLNSTGVTLNATDCTINADVIVN